MMKLMGISAMVRTIKMVAVVGMMRTAIMMTRRTSTRMMGIMKMMTKMMVMNITNVVKLVRT